MPERNLHSPPLRTSHFAASRPGGLGRAAGWVETPLSTYTTSVILFLSGSTAAERHVSSGVRPRNLGLSLHEGARKRWDNGVWVGLGRDFQLLVSGYWDVSETSVMCCLFALRDVVRICVQVESWHDIGQVCCHRVGGAIEWPMISNRQTTWVRSCLSPPPDFPGTETKQDMCLHILTPAGMSSSGSALEQTRKRTPCFKTSQNPLLL